VEGCCPPEGPHEAARCTATIGDFTLFWTGPLSRGAEPACRSVLRKDHFIGLLRAGQGAAYFIRQHLRRRRLSRRGRPVLRRLSQQFELCAFGLSQVRKEWERTPPPVGLSPNGAEIG